MQNSTDTSGEEGSEGKGSSVEKTKFAAEESMTESTKLDKVVGKSHLSESAKAKRMKRCTQEKMRDFLIRIWRHIVSHRTLILLCTFIFLVLTGGGITICHFFADAEEEQVRADALAIAYDTGKWFSEQLDLAILPLFSLAQFATELEIFHDLPDRVGRAGEPGSLPFLPRDDNGTSYRRNITGVCDDPALWEKFTQISSTLKRNANMEGVLVNLQLAPQAVVCLLHPLNNTEDFADGIFMDNTGAWGMDLLTDPLSRYIAAETLKQTEVIVAGPRPLRQCKGCHPAVEEAFIARLPIVSDDHQIIVDGEAYNRWGFATALINWKQLVERSGIYETFESNNLGFLLTRTDQKFDENTNKYNEEVRARDFSSCVLLIT